MFPFEILRLCGDQRVSIELKNGEKLDGVMVFGDAFMNLRLKDVIRTSKDGQAWTIKEIYVKGTAVQGVRLPNDVLDEAQKIINTQEQSFVNYMKNMGTRNNVKQAPHQKKKM